MKLIVLFALSGFFSSINLASTLNKEKEAITPSPPDSQHFQSDEK